MKPTSTLEPLDRRAFLQGAGSAAIFLAAHGSAASALGAARAAERRGAKAEPYHGPENPRILRLELRTAAPLGELVTYYRDLLGLAVLENLEDRLTLAAGSTALTFLPAAPGAGEPTYHFAFNIPENKLFEARTWQLERTPILKRPPDAYSHSDFEDVTDFWHWNATSVFFEDPAGNLLEYIARHDLPNAAPGPFTSKDILYASEIGFVAGDVPAFGEELQAGTGLGLYFAGGSGFRAFGDPNGLLLVLEEGRSRWKNQQDWAVYPTQAAIRDGRSGRFEAEGRPYQVEMRSEGRR